MRTDGVKGHLDMVLLGILASRPLHGYAVIAELRTVTSGALDLNEGAVYPALHRLEDLGHLGSRWEQVDGRRRRLYSITAPGQRALSAERRQWMALVEAIDRVIDPARPAAATS